MIEPDDILMLAAQAGLVRDLELALRLGASANQFDEDGFHAMHMAALSNHPQIVKILLNRGAELDPKDSEGLTPFQLALDTGRYISAQALAAAGCDLNVTWPDGKTALHKLAAADRWTMIDEIGSLCDTSLRDSNGKTALQVAAAAGNAFAARSLLANGSDLSELAGVDLPDEVAKATAAWRAGVAVTQATS